MPVKPSYASALATRLIGRNHDTSRSCLNAIFLLKPHGPYWLRGSASRLFESSFHKSRALFYIGQMQEPSQGKEGSVRQVRCASSITQSRYALSARFVLR